MAPAPKAIPALPEGWQHFLLSIGFIVVVPLGVLVVDLAIKHEVPDQDLFLTFGVYIVAAGASSRSIAILGISIILSAAYFVAYGVAAALPDGCPHIIQAHTALGLLMRTLPPLFFTLVSGAER